MCVIHEHVCINRMQLACVIQNLALLSNLSLYMTAVAKKMSWIHSFCCVDIDIALGLH